MTISGLFFFLLVLWSSDPAEENDIYLSILSLRLKFSDFEWVFTFFLEILTSGRIKPDQRVLSRFIDCLQVKLGF